MSREQTISPEDYVEGSFEPAPRFAGFVASAAGEPTSSNPHPRDTAEWREWLAGYHTPSGEAWGIEQVSAEGADAD